MTIIRSGVNLTFFSFSQLQRRLQGKMTSPSYLTQGFAHVLKLFQCGGRLVT